MIYSGLIDSSTTAEQARDIVLRIQTRQKPRGYTSLDLLVLLWLIDKGAVSQGTAASPSQASLAKLLCAQVSTLRKSIVRLIGYGMVFAQPRAGYPTQLYINADEVRKLVALD